ncbi:DUF3667 domain-containing protein [Dokdonia sp.]|uniref:DUF3667 domain-containing protein n=1 Tax=Dokdonia sp. TaxID=2024995 RepID=UPI003263BFAD
MGKIAKRKQALLEVRDTCINCEEPLALDQRFCSSCGGKRVYNRITWRNLFEDFVDRFLNVENAFLRTFLGLFKRPEDVIGGYMHGMRKKYLPAFSYFAVAITIASVYAFIIKNWFLDDMILAQTSIYKGSVAEVQKDMVGSTIRTMMEHQSLTYFAMIPILALLSRLVFWNYKKYNLVEHFVIYLYGYSHIAMLNTIVGICFVWNQTLAQIFGFVSIILMIVYMGYVLKRLFKLDMGSIVLKTGLFFLIGAILFGLLMIIIAVIGVYLAKSGQLDNYEFFRMMKEQVEAQRAMQEAVKDSINSDTMQHVIQTVKDSIR